jgi:hypothetical protein
VYRGKEEPLSLSAEIDWQKLSADLGLLREDGESGGSDDARRALELIIGEDALRASVDHYVAYRRGFGLARSVLWQLRPWSAMRYCYEIFKGPQKIAIRRAAVELLRSVADRRVLPWIPEFLDDSDPDIQSWGIGVLDQLLFSDLIWPEEAEELIKVAELHQNQLVRDGAERIRRYLRTRAEMNEPTDPANG